MTRKRMTLLTGGASLALLLLLIAAPIDAAQTRDKNHDSQSPNVSQLIQDLHSRDLHRRIKAINSLAAMKPLPPKAIPALIQVLKNPDPTRIVSRFAVNALTEAGAPAIPALSRLLQDKSRRSAETRLAAVYALGGMAKREPAVWPILIGTFKDPYVQPWASIQVAKIGAPVVPLLGRALRDNNPGMRRGAVAALQMAEGAAKDATPELAEALKDSDPSIRALAADDLARVGPPAKNAVPALTAALKDPVRYVRDSAVYALAKVDPSDKASIPILIEALKFNGSVQHWGQSRRWEEWAATPATPSRPWSICSPRIRTRVSVSQSPKFSDGSPERMLCRPWLGR